MMIIVLNARPHPLQQEISFLYKSLESFLFKISKPPVAAECGAARLTVEVCSLTASSVCGRLSVPVCVGFYRFNPSWGSTSYRSRPHVTLTHKLLFPSSLSFDMKYKSENKMWRSTALWRLKCQGSRGTQSLYLFPCVSRRSGTVKLLLVSRPRLLPMSHH